MARVFPLIFFCVRIWKMKTIVNSVSFSGKQNVWRVDIPSKKERKNTPKKRKNHHKPNSQIQAHQENKL